jgi:hypothetical protein
MKEVKKVEKVIEEEELVDVTCDICMNTCRDSMDLNHEFLTLEVNWGYGSDKDGETWKAHVCEECSTNFLDKLILFQKGSYLTKSSKIHEGLNKVNNRKRKIRKTVGVNVNIQIDEKDDNLKE